MGENVGINFSILRRSEVVARLIFFVVAVTPFPFGIGPEPQLLRRVAPGVLWVAALLATLLGLPRLFVTDYTNGTLVQSLLSLRSFVLLIASRVEAHRLSFGLPLVLIAPLLGLQFDSHAATLQVLVVALLTCTPVLSLIGAVEAHAAGLGAGPQLSILGALLVITVFFAPWAATVALRIALE